MKIDLVGPRQRGLAMGINESVGYVAVGSMAYLTGASAMQYGYRDTLFFVGIVLALIGLALSYFLVKDTHQHVQKEQEDSGHAILESVFKETTYKNPNLGSITQAGLVNNLNDGMVWGILPVLLIQLEFDLKEIGKLVAVYPLVWGFFQVITGKLSDHLNKKYMLVFGMFLQGVALTGYWQGESFNEFFIYSVLLGLGTAIVYPTFLSAISDYVSPGQRAASIGVFRLWRDLGYAIGALLSGIIADLYGVEFAVLSIALVTFLSALIIQLRMA
jgi:predicted MFS family arabinose efflux permease